MNTSLLVAWSMGMLLVFKTYSDEYAPNPPLKHQSFVIQCILEICEFLNSLQDAVMEGNAKTENYGSNLLSE